ncbi:MAG TPA: hypothetical protein VGG27_20475 [Magnetospirillaceae bacterium]|jgi:hypothetical protein
MIRAAAFAACCCLVAHAALADEDFELHGYGDYRLVVPAQETSWVNGGLGKTRFGGGGVDGRFGAAGLVGKAQLAPDLEAVADVQLTSSDSAELDLAEAYLRYRPVSTTRWRYTIKAGEFFPPISFENQGIGWTSPWTLTPSAINSWVGEELRAIGTEASLEWRGDDETYEAGFALFGANDPAGTILMDRGWSFDDLVNGIGSQIRMPDAIASRTGDPTPYRYDPFLEIDNKPGYYADFTWRSREWGRVTLLRYDNNADPSADLSNGVYAWRTQFWSLGGQTRFGDLDLLAQVMTGSTQIAPSATFNRITDFQAGYLMAAITFGEWQPALRLDLFGTQQPGVSGTSELSEHGNAVTLALNWRPKPWLRYTAELLRVDSWRLQRLQEGLSPHAVDIQGQLATRVFF